MRMQDLQDRVAKAADKVSKCAKTIERHEGQLTKKVDALVKKGVDINNLKAFKWNPEGGGSDLYWDICEVEHKQNDIVGATRKLKNAEVILANWQSKLDIEIEKERFLSEQAPAIIIEFLNKWKEQAREWYIQAHVRYLKLTAEYTIAKEAAEERYFTDNPKARSWGDAYNKAVKGDSEVKRTARAVAVLGNTVAVMATYRKEDERLVWLENMLEEDRKAKLFDLIHRIHSVTGTITDASGLRVSEKGNLDGIIVGEKSKAKVETIGAGGYNIQVFHYRTLVHEIKE